jgi:Bacterial signalling protein N terminal repeat
LSVSIAPDLFPTLAGGVVQGLAIASMHYTAMAATYFVPVDAPAGLTTPLFAQDLLAFMIAGAILVVCTGNPALLGFMSLQQNVIENPLQTALRGIRRTRQWVRLKCSTDPLPRPRLRRNGGTRTIPDSAGK